MKNALEIAEKEQYMCPGPSVMSGLAVGSPGKMMTYRTCLMLPDCSCQRYLQQCAKIEQMTGLL